MTQIRIIAAVLDTQQLILYKEDGSEVVIPQGDARIKGILEKATPILTKGGVATITLEPSNDYANFEKKTNGLVKLFRVAKAAVSHIFGSDEDRLPPVTLGKVPNQEDNVGASTADNVRDVVVNQKKTTDEAINEIMAKATPVSSEGFKASDTKEDETIVAHVDGKLVPGVEALSGQFSHSVKLGSTEGVTNLLKRLAATIDKRGHSVQDVLRFLEKADLPIADDGSIIAYKMLNRKDRRDDSDIFVDCHTGKIPQKVGSYVCVDESLVDRNRRNECSNGLHIARRGYLRSFGGDVCVLTKISPEDVVTVPHGDPNKVRVCGYHILSVIPDADVVKLKANRPMTDSPVTQRLLGEAISGRHIEKLEEVRVTEQLGRAFQITHLKDRSVQKFKVSGGTVTAVALDDATTRVGRVDPVALNKEIQQQKAVAAPAKASVVAAPKPEKLSTRQQIALDFYQAMNNADLTIPDRQRAAQSLLDHKKRSKVGWSVLAMPTNVEHSIETVMKLNAKPSPTPKEEPKVEAKAQPKPQSKAAPAKKAVKAEPVAIKATELTNQQLEAIETAKAPLTAQQKNALRLVAEGVSKNEASRRSGVSTRTIGRLLARQEDQAQQPPTEEKTVEPDTSTTEPPKKTPPNRAEVARQLYERARNDKSQWGNLWLHKRTAKQSWEALGFDKQEIDRIQTNKPDFI